MNTEAVKVSPEKLLFLKYLEHLNNLVDHPLVRYVAVSLINLTNENEDRILRIRADELSVALRIKLQQLYYCRRILHEAELINFQTIHCEKTGKVLLGQYEIYY